MGFNVLKWVKILRWIAIITSLITIFSLVFVLVLYRWPFMTELVKCQTHMKDLYDATQRYRATHDGEYPESLNELSVEYLKDLDVLYCPLDKEHGEKTSYTYTPPKEGSKGTDPMISCKRHRAKAEFDLINAYITVDGTPVMKPIPNTKPGEQSPELVVPKTMEQNQANP